MKSREKMPEHTFVICAYQESPYLEECICSLLRQSVRSNILIATSTPNPYICSLGEKYGLPVKVNKVKTGLATDWNFAVEQSMTSYVTLAHQDDIYCSDYTQNILSALKICKHPLIAFTDYCELRHGVTVKTNRILRIKRLLLCPLKFKRLWKNKFVRRRILSLGSAICCPSVTLVKKNLPMPVFENNMRSNIDWQAWERISRLKGEFVYVSRILMKHRIHSASTTSEIIQEDGRNIEDLQVFCKFWPEPIARFIAHFYKAGEHSNQIEKGK